MWPFLKVLVLGADLVCWLTIWHWLLPRTPRTPTPRARPSSPSDPPDSSQWQREALRGDRCQPGEQTRPRGVCWTISASLTFHEELRGALFLSHRAAVGRVVGQRAVVDGEVAHAADALEDVPLVEERATVGNVENMLQKWLCSLLLTYLLEFPSSSLAWEWQWGQSSVFGRTFHKHRIDSGASPSSRMNLLSVLQPFHFHIWIGDLDGQLDLVAFGHLVSRIQFLEEGCVRESVVGFTSAPTAVGQQVPDGRTNLRFSSPPSSSSSAASACLSCLWCHTEKQSSDTPWREPC